MFQKILVCVDGSLESMHACRTAANIAKRCGSRVRVINVCEVDQQALDMMMLEAGSPDSPTGQETCSVRDVLERQALAEFNKAGLEAQAVRFDGNPVHHILNYAREFNPDLIVLGNRGCSQLDEILIGSVSISVARHAHCPVLIARCKPDALRHEEDFQKVLVGADCSDHSYAAIKLAMEMASILHFEVSIVNVCEAADAVSGTIDSNLEACDSDRIMRFISAAAVNGIRSDSVQPVLRQEHGNPHEVLTAIADEEDTDLIIVGSRGRNALVSMVLGSVSENIVRKAHCSVMVVRT